jgi:RHS repeat-associated protein
VTTTYTYDGDGRRVKKVSGSTTTVYVYDAQGQLAAEYAPVQPAACVTCYLTADTLGSTRMITDETGTPRECHDYLPFGEEIARTSAGACYTASTSNTLKFTGKERDAETGDDYFGARYLAPAQGRWTSADWSAKEDPVPYARLDNPQSLNLYQYVVNNPLSNADDDGHAILYAPGLMNEQKARDSVRAILADPNTSSSLSGYLGVGPTLPGTSPYPNLTIQSGDLSYLDSKTQAPDGSPGTTITQGGTLPDIQTTRSTATDSNGVTTSTLPETTLTSTTITIDNRTSAGDVPGVMVHESVHAGEALAQPAQFHKDAVAEKSLAHDKRHQEERANKAQKAYGPEINKAVKQIEKDRRQGRSE